MLVILVKEFVRKIGGDGVIGIGDANTSNVKSTYHSQGEEALLPMTIQHHTFVQGKETLDFGGIVRLDRKKNSGNMNTLRNGSIARRVDVVIV